MITTSHIIKPNAVIAFIDGKQFTVRAGSLKYKAVLDALNSGKNDQFVAAILESEAKTLSKLTGQACFVEVGGVIFLDGIEIIGALQTKLSRLVREGFDLSYLVNFVRRLRKNPSRTAVSELYDFLAYAELPITPDGCFLAYKGVNPDYWSCTAGKTNLTKGKVNPQGRIFNGIGEVIECERVEVDDDRRNQCSNGLHVGSHDYATRFGKRTVVVKVDPAHVVSVPLDESCQKMRVCGYTVVADYTGEIKEAVATSKAVGIASKVDKTAAKIEEKIKSLRKRGGKVTLKRIQSALSPLCPTLHEIRDIASNKLGYTVAVDKSNPTSVGALFIP